MDDVAEARDGIAEPGGLDEVPALDGVVAVEAVFAGEIVTDVYGPVIHTDGRRRRADEARCTGGIDEVRARDELDKLRSNGVGRGIALGIAEDEAIDVNLLPLAQPLIGEEEESFVPDDG